MPVITVRLPPAVVLHGVSSLYENAAKFNALDVPGKPETLKLILTKSPLPCISAMPKSDMISVPALGLATDNVRPPPCELPTVHTVTPNVASANGVKTAGLYVIVISADIAPNPVMFVVFTGTVAVTPVND